MNNTDINNNQTDSTILLDIVTKKMPFGKYQGKFYTDIPEHYLVWFKQKGFPKGRIGEILSTLYEIRLNGLEYLLKDIKRKIIIDTE